MKKTIELYLISLAGGSHSGKTRRIYRQVLGGLSAIVDKPIAAVTIIDLRQWQAGLNNRVEGGDLSVWTLHLHTRCVRRFFRWCVEDGVLADSPAARLPLPTLPVSSLPKNISDEDMRRLLSAAYKSGPRDYAVVLFLADTAARVGGLVSLGLGALDMDGGSAVVCEKGHRVRRVFFGEQTARALAAWLVARGDAPGPVFLSRRGGGMTTGSVYQLLRRLARRGGVCGAFNPHSLRHAWARRALQAGMDLGRVSRLLGHSQIAVTHQFYATWDTDELRDAHRRYDTIALFG